jgi:acyl transferase domain-containing protein
MKGSPLIVGSVKTNIGHSESAAGIAGLLKACMAVHHGRIPPSLHLRKPNPHIAWGSIPIKICTTGCNWPRAEGVRRAGVSSFGASGTNAHVIVEQKPFSVPKEQPFTGERANHVLTLSSPAANSLQDLGLDMADFLEQTSCAFVDICFTSNVGRRRSSYGIAVVAGSKAEAAIKLREELRRLASQSEPQRRPPLQRNPSVAYWLPNLDEIDLRQSRALYRAEPAFHRALDEAAAVLQIEASEPWLVAVRGAEGESHAPVTKGAAFCISNALCQIWSGWGVKLGEVIVGDNVSRLVAACQVGSLGLENVHKVWRFVEAEFQEVEWGKVFQEGGMLRSALLPVYCRWNGCDLTDNIRTYKYWKHSEWSSLSCNGSRSEATAPRLALRLSGGSRDESGSSQTAANSISSEAVFGVGLNIAEALAVMYRAGVKVDWDAVDRGFVRSRVALPRSRMSRRRFWPQVPAHGFLRSTATLSLLIVRVFRFPEQHVTIAEGNTEGAMRRFYFDCEVNGQVAVADACYLAMCIEAQSTILGGLACQLVGVELMPKLVLMQRDCRSLRLTLSERPGIGREFRIAAFFSQ